MEICEFCDKEIRADGDGSWYCTGIEELGVDPFAAEIYDDYTEVMMCPGWSYERAMDI